MSLNDQNKNIFFEAFHMEPEMREKFELYATRLEEWNAKVNLVARSTIPDMWARHFLDSAQLYPLIKKRTKILVDIGSGAGFPGLVLGIMGNYDVHLIESIGKKARFLEEVAKEVAPNVTVHHARAEAVKGLRADVVTARAVTALPTLLSFSKPFLGEHSRCIFLKGQKADAELTEALKYWTFKCDRQESVSDPSGCILTLRHLKVLRKNDPKRSIRRS